MVAKTDKPTAGEKTNAAQDGPAEVDPADDAVAAETAGVDSASGVREVTNAEAGAETASDGAVEAAPEPEQARNPAAAVPPARGSAVAGLSLLVALLALGLSAWLFYLSRLSAVEPDSDAELRIELRAELAAHTQQAEQATASERRRLQDASAELQRGLQQELRALRSSNEEQFNSLQAALARQRQNLLEYTTTDRSDWMLAEAEYLLRLANQRIIMAGDTRSAIALLGSADSILLELDDSELHPVRAAVAADLAALRAVPQVDVEGTWLRLQALIGEVDRLVLFVLPEAPPDAAPVAEGGWEKRLEQGFRAALEKVSNYVVITQRDAAYKPMLSPQWEGMVRQNLRMLLEQARAALLSGNQMLYRQSLKNTQHWLNEFFSLKESGVSALDAELQDLLKVIVGREYPDIHGSLAALKSIINTRHMVAKGQ
ncbi:MAG: uroporphyrinogen-III C-methyltransferase [Gammaproteobacteria bacterium]|nr:uroporphyrinogen-III C-methyltransferase [Gammaproteobacteria bacterium]